MFIMQWENMWLECQTEFEYELIVTIHVKLGLMTPCPSFLICHITLHVIELEQFWKYIKH